MTTDYMTFDEHVVYYEDEDGQEQELTLVFEFGVDRDLDVGDGETMTLRTGRASFVLQGEVRSVRASAEDRIQLIYRLMKICGSELLRSCEDVGLAVYQYRPGDAKEALDFFR